MQSECYRCGAIIEEGSAFCPSCNAPQIKVSVPQPITKDPIARPSYPDMPDSVPAQAIPAAPIPTGGIQWKTFRRLALPLAAVAGVGIAIFAPVGLLLFVAFTIYAVGRYRRDHIGPLRAMHGAKMGAFSGLISFLVATALNAALLNKEYRQQTMQILQNQFGGNPDPQIQHMMRLISTDQGFAIFLVCSLLFGLVIFLVVSSFIGAIAVTFSAPRSRR